MDSHFLHLRRPLCRGPSGRDGRPCRIPRRTAAPAAASDKAAMSRVSIFDCRGSVAHTRGSRS